VSVPHPNKRLIRRSQHRFIDTSVGFYAKPVLPKDALLIVGDIYTNSLAWRLRGRNVIYYSEYAAQSSVRATFLKRFLFALTRLWFRNRPFIVPTRHAERTWRSVSTRVLYFPQLYNGPLASTPPPALKEKKLKLLFIGVTNDWKKNLPLLLTTLASMKNLDFEIGVVGQLDSIPLDPKRRFPVNVYRELLGKRVTFYGNVTPERLHAIRRNYNVFVLPSIVDPIGAVVLESMAAGLPILVTKSTGASSYVEHGKNAVIFEPNAEGIRTAINAVRDPKRRVAMGKASLALVRDQYWLGNPAVVQATRARFDAFLQSLR
jgi:glycosyltransferase involved in cell wall biosynthesis